MRSLTVNRIKLHRQGAWFGKDYIPLTEKQIELERTWKGFLETTLGPELKPEEMEALERALKKFKGVSEQKLENPYFWLSWAPTWAEYSRRNLNRGFQLLNRVDHYQKYRNILSLGAGSCWQEVFLAQSCGPASRLIALDFSPHMIKQGVVLARKKGVKNIDFIVGKVEDIPVVAESVDLVISLHLLDLVADVPRVLRGIKRVLAPRPWGRYFFLFAIDPGARLSAKAEGWKSMVLEAGLEGPRLYYLQDRNYQGKRLRLLMVTNLDVHSMVDPGWVGR